MAEPTSHDLHVNALMTNISIGYKNDMYISDEIFPQVPVRRQSDIIPKYNQSDWFRDTAELRAPGTAARSGGFTVDNTDTYYCPRYSYAFDIPDEFRDNTDDPYNMDRDGTLFATDKVYLRRELQFVTTAFTSTVWTTDKAGAAGGGDFVFWSDYAASTPLRDITDYLDDVEALTARMPNTGVLGKQVWSQLKWHPDVIDTIKYTQRAQMTVDIFGALIEVPNMKIGRGIYTSTAEGTAEASVAYTRIWGKNALFVYVPPAPSLFTPAAGYTITWSRVANSMQYMRQLRDDYREVDTLEANSYFVHKVTSAKSGAFLGSAVA